MNNIMNWTSVANLRCGMYNKSDAEYAEFLNDSTFFSILQRCLMLSARRIRWKGLPENVPEWYIETCLFWYDNLAGANDENIGGVIFPAFNAGMVNPYNIPTKYNLIGVQYNKVFDTKDICVLRDQFLGSGVYKVLEPLIYNLYESYRTRDVNLANNKVPIIYKTTKRKELTAKNFFNQIRKNRLAIFTEHETADGLQGESVAPPYLTDKLDTHIRDGWTDILTVLGIQSQSVEKAERVQVAEVQASNEQTIMYRQAAIDCREKWAKECNEKLGWNLSVEWAIESREITGGNIRGELYNDIERDAKDNSIV